MQASETVYEFGSSPDEDDDTEKTRTPKKRDHHQQQPTNIAGSNLRPNKTSFTSINQKLNTIPSNHSPNLKSNNNPSTAHQRHSSSIGGNTDISASDDQLLLNETKLNTAGSSNLLGGASSVSNTSNTSLSSTTNSSRGNASQSGNQSLSVTSQKSIGHQPSSSSQQQNPNFDSNVISERVKNLATQIYQELKRVISRCNYDEDILSGLMPLIVRVLESLDLALIENQQLQVELELCKDDNEQLVIMFEKEKAAKRAIDKKLIESEYAYEEERQQYQQKIESLDSVVKMFELKAKNASDQATRFEEKEAERKKEYKKLHDRYTELLKSHCDVVERFRHHVGSAEVAHLSSINVPQQMVSCSSDLTINEQSAHHVNKVKLKHDDTEFEKGSSTKTRDALKSWNAETELTLEDASLVVIEDMLEPQKVGDGSSHNESDRGTSEPEVEHEKESENDSIAYTSMEKEFRKLIQENKDLLNTKNALNVVKDDLIAEVDRLTNEVSMYEQAVEQLNSTKDQMKQKVSALDAELRKTKEELEKAKQKIRENNEEGVPYSQRKRFGRAEMAKVLMERNNYKERFMELQDAVRYTELVRANKVETEKRSGLWKFFSNLFGTLPVPPRDPLAIIANNQSVVSRTSSPVVSYHGSPLAITSSDQQIGSSGNQLAASDANSIRGGSIRSTNQRLSSNSDLIVLMDSDLNIDRSRALREVSGRLTTDMPGYIHAYGWSLPASSVKSLALSGSSDLGVPTSAITSPKVSTILGGTSSYAGTDPLTLSPGDGSVGFGKLAGLQVPVPQYCRPLTGDSLGMKIWCATAIDLSGGETIASDQSLEEHPQIAIRPSETSRHNTSRDPDSSGSTVNISTSNTPLKSPNQHALRMLEQEVNQALNDNQSPPAVVSRIELGSPSQRQTIKTTSEMVMSALPMADDSEELSTCVWICSTQHSRSKITIIDIKTKPNELLDSFYVSTFLYCMKSIPGSKPSDLPGLTGVEESNASNASKNSKTLDMLKELIANQKREFYKLIEVNFEDEQRLKCDHQGSKKSAMDKISSPDQSPQFKVSFEEEAKEQDTTRCKPRTSEDDAEISRILDNNVSVGIATLQKLNDFVAHTQPQSSKSMYGSAGQPGQQIDSGLTTPTKEGDCQAAVYYQPISTYLPTVWMGGKDSVLYIHSAIGQWKDCVAYVKLRDSILQICHFRGRVFVALADGSLCVFFRNVETKQWELSQYLLIDVNLLAEVTTDSVDLIEAGTVDVQSKLSASADATTASPSSLSEQLKEVSIEKQSNESPTASTSKISPAVSKQKSRSKVAGIRCLEIANKNLWIGYRNRVLIIDPITLKLRHTFNVVPQVDNQIRQLISMKDGVFCCLRSDLILRLYSSLKPYQYIQNIDVEPVVTRLISPKTFVISHITAMKVADNTLWIGNAHGIILTIPCKLVPQISEAPIVSRSGDYEESPCSLSIARFVPRCDITNAQISFHGHKDAVKFFIHAHNLMLSGGQGYLDFRLDMDDQSKSISDKSHLILWQLPK